MDTRPASGRQAEQQALQYLQARGLRLLTRNFRSRHGEIDLVMQDTSHLVFVEVRYRAGAGYGGAAASIDRNKRSRLVSTALYYLRCHPELARRPARFDVMALSTRDGRTQIEWLRDAFQAD